MAKLGKRAWLKTRCPLVGREGSTPSPGTALVPRRSAAALAVLAAAASLLAAPAASEQTFRIDHVTDGDTVVLRGGARVRLVQIDAPEEYFAPECYGLEAAAVARRLLPPGTRVRLLAEPATEPVDDFGRLLRYVVRARDGVNVNLWLVAVGAAAPYFYRGVRGRFARTLERLALEARERRLGLWGRCPGTPYDPERSVRTGPPR